MNSPFKKYTTVAGDIPFSAVAQSIFSGKSDKDIIERLKTRLGVKFVYPVKNGRTALYVILKSALQPESKVILPGYSCPTVLAAVIKSGMRPIICDSDPIDLGYDYDALKQTITNHPDCSAVVVCHLFGIPQEINQLREMVGDRMLIDDAAQAFGIESEGRMLGTIGDIGFYSFGRGKNLAVGGGGLLVTNDDALAEKTEPVWQKLSGGNTSLSGTFKAFAYNRAITPHSYNIISRLPGMKLGLTTYDPNFKVGKCSPLHLKLIDRLYESIDQLNKDRLKVAEKYFDRLSGHPDIDLPGSKMSRQLGSLRFPILIKDLAKRDQILSQSESKRLGLSGMYPIGLHQIKTAFVEEGLKLPGAELIAQSIITLPTHHYILAGDSTGELTSRIVELVL